MHWPPLWLSPGKSNYTGKYLGCQSRDTKKLPNYYSAWARLTSWRQNLMTLIYICLHYSQISVSFYSITSCQMNFQKNLAKHFWTIWQKKVWRSPPFFCFCIFLHFRCPRSFLSLVSLSFRLFVFIQWCISVGHKSLSFVEISMDCEKSENLPRVFDQKSSHSTLWSLKCCSTAWKYPGSCPSANFTLKTSVDQYWSKVCGKI